MKKLKALLVNGSPRAKGCTYTALTELKNTLEQEGMEVELIHVGHKDVHGCIACRKCKEIGKCVFDDIVNEVAPKFNEADAFVIGAPVYYASPTGGAINKYFSISSMPIATSQYWNMVYGGQAEEVLQDKEGLQTMRTLGRNIAFMAKSIALGKERFGLPEKEQIIFTNFHHLCISY